MKRKIVKNKRKKKGFTLVELLSVIVILGIVTIIVLPVITNQIDRARDQGYSSQVNTILEAAKKYANVELIGVTNTKRYNYDIVFVLDDSASMNGDCTDPERDNSLERLKNSVEAINDIMKKYLAYENNRVGIVTFHSSVSTLLPLDHYTSTSGEFIQTLASYTSYTDPYYTHPSCKKEENKSEWIGPYYNVHRSYKIVPGVKNSKGESINNTTYYTGGGTNSQEAIYEGMKLFLNNKSDNIPIMFFITDGVISTSVHSSYITPDANHVLASSDTITNMYNSILTSMYYKYEVYNKQSRMPKIYSIGLDIVGDREKAYLHPSTENLSSTNTNVKKLKTLLLSDDNPYKDNFLYSEKSFTGKNLSNAEIQDAIGNSITTSTEFYEITIKSLVDSGYLTEDALIDPRTNEKMMGFVSLKYVKADNNEEICDDTESHEVCTYVYKFIDTSVNNE